MQLVQFITDRPASALEQIHRELGPEAVVVSVRRLPAQGVARLWQMHGRIEVLAGVPDRTPSTEPGRQPARAPVSEACSSNAAEPGGPAGRFHSPDRWQTVAWLEAMGLLPAHADRLQQQLKMLHPSAPTSLDAEWEAVRGALAGFWSPAIPLDDGRASSTHVFIGPPGSGKTTALCKWLTLAVLAETHSACVWRLDSAIANTAEFLTIHCEMLGVPLERFCSDTAAAADLHFVDLPGVEADDPRALGALRGSLALLPAPRVHLVLNAAYETDVLLTQWRAFAALQPEDLILTHLDEETRRVKLWNIVLGTNCIIRFLSAGQKIPGEFREARPDLLFPSEIAQCRSDGQAEGAGKPRAQPG